MPVQLVYPGALKPRRWARRTTGASPVRLPRRSLSRVGSARFSCDRQSSVRKTSGCPAPLFDALVWRHETQVERATGFWSSMPSFFRAPGFVATLVDHRNANELPEVLHHTPPFYRWLDGAAVRFDPLMVSIFENLSRLARENITAQACPTPGRCQTSEASRELTRRTRNCRAITPRSNQT